MGCELLLLTCLLGLFAQGADCAAAPGRGAEAPLAPDIDPGSAASGQRLRQAWAASDPQSSSADHLEKLPQSYTLYSGDQPLQSSVPEAWSQEGDSGRSLPPVSSIMRREGTAMPLPLAPRTSAASLLANGSRSSGPGSESANVSGPIFPEAAEETETASDSSDSVAPVDDTPEDASVYGTANPSPLHNGTLTEEELNVLSANTPEGRHKEELMKLLPNSSEFPTTEPPTPKDELEMPADPEEIKYWVDDACRRHGEQNLVGQYIQMNEAVAKVQCCTAGAGIAQAPSVCVRKVRDTCLAGSSLLTYAQAVQICHGAEMRLCTETEISKSSNAQGCCRSGCEMDDAFTWTSTLSQDSVAYLNHRIGKRVTELRREHEDLLANLGMERILSEDYHAAGYRFEEQEHQKLETLVTSKKNLTGAYDGLNTEKVGLRSAVADLIRWAEHNNQ